MEDFPKKSEVQGGARKRKNPWAEKLKDRMFHQRVVKEKKNGKRRNKKPRLSGWDDMDFDL